MIPELISLISNIEGKKLIDYSKKDNHYDIAPINTIGEPMKDASAQPCLAFQVSDDELKVQWMYLSKKGQGLGTNIIQWLIDYCKKNRINKISIRYIEENNRGMRTLVEKFDFRLVRKGDSLNYELLLENCYSEKKNV